MTYVLILVILVAGQNSSTTNVPGFASMEQCRRAGGVVQQQMMDSRVEVKSFCVEH